MTIWRTIADAGIRMNPGAEKSRFVGGSYTLRLAGCDHEAARKLSARIPKSNKVRCYRCETLAAGSFGTSFDIEKARATDERWDKETMMPVRTERPMTDVEIEYWRRR